MDPIGKLRLPWALRRMAERFMITGYDRRNPGGRIPAQIIQEVCRFQRAMGVIFEMILAECGRSSAAKFGNSVDGKVAIVLCICAEASFCSPLLSCGTKASEI